MLARSSAIRFFCIWLARLRVGLDQVVDRGQRVEQEVRLHLRLHGGHARFHHLALERFGLGRLGGLGGLHLGLDAALVGGLDDGRGQDPQQRQVGQEVAPVDARVRLILPVGPVASPASRRLLGAWGVALGLARGLLRFARHLAARFGGLALGLDGVLDGLARILHRFAHGDPCRPRGQRDADLAVSGG
jgi:hypothetical protein